MGKQKQYPQDTTFLDSIQPKGDNQSSYWASLQAYNYDHDGYDGLIAAYGAAGVGKTFLASAVASKLYLSKQIKNIIIIRPMVEVEFENVGALPGDLGDKFDPWVKSITEPLKQFLGASKFNCDYNKRIHAEPMSFLRGRTFDDSFIIVDEAQNLTKSNLKMILTRAGRNTRVVLCGDTSQCDLPKHVTSGLDHFINEVIRQGAPVDLIKFTSKDCERGPICKLALDLYDNAE